MRARQGAMTRLVGIGVALASTAALGIGAAPGAVAAGPAPLAVAGVDAGRPIPFRFLEFLCETPRRLMPVLRTTSSSASGARMVQYALRFLDYPVGPVDGIYGRVTRAAVRQYQRDFGLVVDGVTGPQTWGSLQRRIC